jgi:Rieske Fe-S protein
LVIRDCGLPATNRRKTSYFVRGVDIAEVCGMSDAHGVVSRRQFCAGACQVASCVTLATIASACGGDGTASPNSPSAMASALPRLGGQFTTGSSVVRVSTAGSALNDVGGAALVESTAGVFLIAKTGATSFQAVDATCTHEGCTITGIDGATYVCPCHGSRYNRSGQVQAGPARSNLRQYATTFADGVLTITL